MNRTYYLSLFLILLGLGCEDKPEPIAADFGKIAIEFDFKVDGAPLETDQAKYTNAAGNQYLVSEIQYFISDVTLYKNGGSSYLVDEWKDIHYIDTDLSDSKDGKYLIKFQQAPTTQLILFLE